MSDNRQTLNTIFKQVNTVFKLLIASTIEEATELLTDQEYEISAVLFEEGTFGKDALQILLDLQNITYVPHYIALINERQPNLIKKLMQSGAFDCVVKPILAEELIRKIEAASRLKGLYKKISQRAEKVTMLEKEKEVFESLLCEQLMKQRLKTDILDLQATVDFAAMIHDHAVIDAHYEGKKLKERVREKLLGKAQAKILIIEDEEDYQSYLKSLLSSTHEVLVADNAVDGVNIAEKEAHLDVIILDIRMPYMDGTEAVALLKKKRPEASIIMLTSSDEPTNIVRSLRDGASEYCIKPIIAEELLSKIGQILEEKFYPKVIDEMINEIQNKHISTERRESLFEELCQKRLSEQKQITVEELMIFFPKLDPKRFENERILNPDMILKKGISQFLNTTC